MEKSYPFDKIKDFLAEHYNDDDLNGLFFGISGDGTDVLGSDLPRPRLAQEIVSYFKRRDDLPGLLDAMKRTREESYAKAFPQFPNPLGSLGSSVNPGEDEAHESEVEGINPAITQTEGGYQIDKPPEDWAVDELTQRELYKGRLGTDLGKDGSASPFVDADRIDKRDILRVRSKTQLRIEYDPGVSLLSGRPIPQFLPEQLPVAQLVIMPLERQSVAPSFVEQTLEHIFLMQLVQVLPLTNLKSMLASTTRKTNRLRLTAELDQKIDNVSANGSPNQSLTTNQTVIGIQGYTRDYLLILSYISQATSNKTEIENQIALLRSLVNSFKLIKPADAEKEEHQLRAAGDKRYKKYVELTAGTHIAFQAKVLFEQWKELDWDSADSSARVISDTKLIQRAIKAFPVKDEKIDSLSQDLDRIDQMTPEAIREWIVSGNKKQPEPTPTHPSFSERFSRWLSPD